MKSYFWNQRKCDYSVHDIYTVFCCETYYMYKYREGCGEELFSSDLKCYTWRENVLSISPLWNIYESSWSSRNERRNGWKWKNLCGGATMISKWRKYLHSEARKLKKLRENDICWRAQWRLSLWLKIEATCLWGSQEEKKQPAFHVEGMWKKPIYLENTNVWLTEEALKASLWLLFNSGKCRERKYIESCESL